jgi:glycosyltransferase involved in cell wall biosynthesis
MKIALLISTYNWPEALELIFESILIQTKLPHEILIADDGSNEKTKEVINVFMEKLNIPVRHFWQEDKGFRKSKILNKTIAQTDADYIIQVDGDCILHRNFIEDHILNIKKNTYLYGSRVNILPNFVKKVFNERNISFNLFSNEIKNKTRAFHFPYFSKFYKCHLGVSKKFRGCNVSFWRKDFIEINGYNEDFEGWGREDSDMVIRLGNKGVFAKRLRYCGIVFHIYHKEKPKDQLQLNDTIEQKTILNKIIKVSNGIDKYLSN